MAGPLRGVGVKGRAIKKKITFFLKPFFPALQNNGHWAIWRGGGGLGLNGPAIKKRTFFGLPLIVAT